MSLSFESLRARLRVQGFRPTLSYGLLAVGLERIGIALSRVFEAPETRADSKTCPADKICILRSPESFSPADCEALREHGGARLLDNCGGLFSSGSRCFAIRARDGRLAFLGWLTPLKEYLPAGSKPCVRIERCFTFPEYRGQGIFPDALRGICAYVHASADLPHGIFIESSGFNAASLHAIRKAGFRERGMLFQIWGRQWYRAHGKAGPNE